MIKKNIVRKEITRGLVSIIIVNWNGLKYLDDCLQSLFNQTYPEIEIILVDNASTDGSVDFVKENFPSVRIFRNSENLGFAEGTNIGIQKSEGDLIALFNQDAIANKNWLANLVEVIESSEDIAAVAGKVYYWGDKYGKNAVFCTWSKVDPYTAVPYNFTGNETKNAVDYLTGCAMLVKKKTIDEIGLLDTGYFLYFDETDWCARMIRAGYKLIYVPDAIVWHVVSGSLENLHIKSMYMTRNWIRFALKNFDLKYIPVFLLFFILKTIFTFLKNIVEFNLNETKVIIHALGWNIVNLQETFKARQKEHNMIKNGISYNRSLPLRRYRTVWIKNYLRSMGK
ncbi:MAG: glycosyl transferase [Candidatus Altiarchaeales archaeon WOR_SM1_79]|nr:MAG: glycosyl transferase [Candidatus Altiarchaeales archaeon WOR_SM1_79]